MEGIRGRVPVETLLLGVSLLALLVYPLISMPEPPPRTRGLAPDPFLSAALRVSDLAALGKIEGSQADLAERRRERTPAGLVRIDAEPGWPAPGDPSLLARTFELPERWTVVRLSIEDFGVFACELTESDLALEVVLADGRTAQAYCLARQVAILPERPRRDRPEPPGPLRIRFGDRGGHVVTELPLVFKEEIDLGGVETGSLRLGGGAQSVRLDRSNRLESAESQR